MKTIEVTGQVILYTPDRMLVSVVT